MDIKKMEIAACISYRYPFIDFFKILGFPNYFDGERKHIPIPFFWGHVSDYSARLHVVTFLLHASEYNIIYEDHMMHLLDNYL